MSNYAYPDYRTANERERDRKRAVAEQRQRDAEAAAERRAALDRIERLQAASSQTPQTHPQLFRRVVLDVHVDHLDEDLAIMSRIMRRIVDARRDAYASNDTTAHRDATRRKKASI